MTEFLTIEKAAELLGANPGTVRRKCINGKFIGAKKEASKWLIPVTAHEKLRQPEHLVGSADPAEANFSEEASRQLLTMYLTPSKLSLKTCYQNLLYINKNENKGWQIPALRTVHKWTEDNVPKQVRILHREGQRAYDAQCASYIQTDHSNIGPGQIWVGDHHQFDFWIRHKNSWLRPWITAWMDKRSRCIVGWHLSACPNQTTVLTAMRAGIEKYGMNCLI